MTRIRAAGAAMVSAALVFLAAGAAAAAPDVLPAAANGRVHLLDVPYVPQSGALCGGAALAMVMRYWGEPGVRAENFAALMGDEADGIRTDSLTAAAARLGWRTWPFSGTPDLVRKQIDAGRPVITMIRSSRNGLHYVVVTAWANGGVIVHDPAEGPNRMRREAAFLHDWDASDRWALLILPREAGRDGTVPPPPDGGGPANDARSTPPAPVAQDTAGHLPAGAACDTLVAIAVRQARSGDPGGAERLLRSAETLCPASGAPPRELAGLRFNAKDWTGAARFAEESLRREPGDAYTWRLLANSRFLAGDAIGALAAWNRVDEPRTDLVRIDGLDRVAWPAVNRPLDLESGAMLTPGAYRRAERRLAALPAIARARLDLKPLPDGRARVDAAVVERPLAFADPWQAGAAGLRAGLRREITFNVADAVGNGELWMIEGRWAKERPRVALSLITPAASGPKGLWRVDGVRERQSYAAADGGVLREDRRTVGLSYSDWWSGDLRAGVSTALDRFGAEETAALGGRVERRWAGDRFAVALEGTHWFRPAGGVPFGRAALTVDWTSAQPARSGWRIAGGLRTAGKTAPRALWSGAGTGTGREPFLRAHPLLEDGVVAGRAFGRSLAHATLERRDRLASWNGIRLGTAAFVDAARAGHTERAEAQAALVDAGAGLRLAGPFGGTIRLDAAHGLTDDAAAVSFGWSTGSGFGE